MGFHLAAGTLNQAALARGHGRAAATHVAGLRGRVRRVDGARRSIDDELVRAEVGYAGAAALLCALLVALYRRVACPRGVVVALACGARLRSEHHRGEAQSPRRRPARAATVVDCSSAGQQLPRPRFAQAWSIRGAQAAPA